MKRRKKKRGFDIGTLAIGIMGMLMTVVPIAFLIYMYITKTGGMCQIDSYGEPIYINCSELITMPKFIEQYDATLYLIIYGIFFLSQFFLSIKNSKSKTIKNCVVVIVLYFIAWILAIYLTSSFLKSLIMLSLHHFWFVAALGMMAEISKKHKSK